MEVRGQYHALAIDGNEWSSSFPGNRWKRVVNIIPRQQVEMSGQHHSPATDGNEWSSSRPGNRWK
jgi:hypothetical protein